MLGYRVPEADEVMLIKGGKSTEEAPFRIERGGKFVLPGFRKVDFLPLTQQQARIEEVCTTTQGLKCNVRSVIAFKIAADDASIYAAGQRFLGDQRTMMAEQTGQIFAGHLRSIVGAMKLEDIIQQRQALAEQVLDASKVEMAAMGLQVDSFQITHIDDQGSGYIDAMAAPHNALIQQMAAIAQAKANQAAAEAEQESQRRQAEYQRETLVVKAQYQAEVDREKETAAQAGPLAQAKAQQGVLAERELLANREASLREAQLKTEVVAPAAAEAERIRIEAQAEADRTTIQADADAHKMEVQATALAAEGRVTLERALIDQLPKLVESASKTLTGANVTLFNGAEGANQLLTAALTQGMSAYQTIKDSIERTNDKNEVSRIGQLSGLSNQQQ